MSRNLLDTTDPFANWARERQAERIRRWTPSKTHEALTDKPPTHVTYRGQVAIVVEYWDDRCWIVTFNGEPTVLHELDAVFHSRDWTLYQG